MKTVSLAVVAMLASASGAHAAPRNFDPYTDGSRLMGDVQQQVARSTPSSLIDEQFRTLAATKFELEGQGTV